MISRRKRSANPRWNPIPRLREIGEGGSIDGVHDALEIVMLAASCPSSRFFNSFSSAANNRQSSTVSHRRYKVRPAVRFLRRPA